MNDVSGRSTQQYMYIDSFKTINLWMQSCCRRYLYIWVKLYDSGHGILILTGGISQDNPGIRPFAASVMW